jgi:hypothetical protein
LEPFAGRLRSRGNTGSISLQTKKSEFREKAWITKWLKAAFAKPYFSKPEKLPELLRKPQPAESKPHFSKFRF